MDTASGLSNSAAVLEQQAQRHAELLERVLKLQKNENETSTAPPPLPVVTAPMTSDTFFSSRLSWSHWNSFGVGTSLTDSSDGQKCTPASASTGLATIQPGLNDEQLKRRQLQREVLKQDLERQIVEKRARILQRRAEEEARIEREEAEIQAYLQKQRQDQRPSDASVSLLSPAILPKPQLSTKPRAATSLQTPPTNRQRGAEPSGGRGLRNMTAARGRPGDAKTLEKRQPAMPLKEPKKPSLKNTSRDALQKRRQDAPPRHRPSIVKPAPPAMPQTASEEVDAQCRPVERSDDPEFRVYSFLFPKCVCTIVESLPIVTEDSHSM